jgi:hypothetical protein
LIGFVDYLIDGIDSLDDECRGQIHIAIQYKSATGRWVDVWNELEAGSTEAMFPDEAIY